MGKYTGIIAGAVITLVGIMALISWKVALVTVIKGILPGVLIFAGIVAVIAGFAEIKDQAAQKKEETK